MDEPEARSRRPRWRERQRRAYEREEPAALALYPGLGKWANGLGALFFAVSAVVLARLTATAAAGERGQHVVTLVFSLSMLGLTARGFFRGRFAGASELAGCMDVNR